MLYDRDPNVPDNYAPREFFLAAIERNKNLHKYSFGACVKGSAQVSLQVCVMPVLVIFGNANNSTLCTFEYLS